MKSTRVYDLIDAPLKSVASAAVGVDVDKACADVISRHVVFLGNGIVLLAHLGDFSAVEINISVE